MKRTGSNDISKFKSVSEAERIFLRHYIRSKKESFAKHKVTIYHRSLFNKVKTFLLVRRGATYKHVSQRTGRSPARVRQVYLQVCRSARSTWRQKQNKLALSYITQIMTYAFFYEKSEYCNGHHHLVIIHPEVS